MDGSDFLDGLSRKRIREENPDDYERMMRSPALPATFPLGSPGQCCGLCGVIEQMSAPASPPGHVAGDELWRLLSGLDGLHNRR